MGCQGATDDRHHRTRRIFSLDMIRGVAVMGIFSVNIIAFAMSRPPISTRRLRRLARRRPRLWAPNLLSSTARCAASSRSCSAPRLLLVIEQAEAKGESPAAVHFRRMLWLLLFGLIHFYLIWFGDILTGYAMIGLVAWFFRDQAPRRLVFWGVLLVLLEFPMLAGMASAPRASPNPRVARPASPETVRKWNEITT